jgi:hypothetical protein
MNRGFFLKIILNGFMGRVIFMWTRVSKINKNQKLPCHNSPNNQTMKGTP